MDNVLQHPTAWPEEIDANINALLESPRGLTSNDVEAYRTEEELRSAIENFLNFNTEIDLMQVMGEYC